MFEKNRLATILFGLGLALGMTTTAVAQLSDDRNATRSEISRRIDRPLSTRIAVTLGGVALIAAELWWFQFSKTQARQTRVKQEIQEIAIIVDGGYSPNRVVVRVGQPVRLNFFRTDPTSCLETVILPDFKRAADLPLDRTTSVEFIPEEPGEFIFHCGTKMFKGFVVVRGKAEGD